MIENSFSNIKFILAGMNKNKLFILLSIFQASFFFTGSLTQNNRTIMHYGVCSNSSEADLLDDIAEMIRCKNSEEYELITLLDRIKGFSEDSTTLGENFSDTGLYRISDQTYFEPDGLKELPEINTNSYFEGNMGDAMLLRNFTRYCKNNYPANHYMLIIRSHGNGAGMCPDAEVGKRDKLYPAELRDVLSSEASVDILGPDVFSLVYFHNTNDNIELAEFSFPYLDAYNFYERISVSYKLLDQSSALAGDVCEAIDRMVVCS